MLTRSMWLAAASSGACCTIPRTVRGVASQLRAPRRAAAAVLHTRGQTRRGFGSDVRDTRAGTVYAVAKEGTGTQPPLLPPNLPSYGALPLRLRCVTSMHGYVSCWAQSSSAGESGLPRTLPQRNRSTRATRGRALEA
jgi:hypothetical protein